MKIYLVSKIGLPYYNYDDMIRKLSNKNHLLYKMRGSISKYLRKN